VHNYAVLICFPYILIGEEGAATNLKSGKLSTVKEERKSELLNLQPSTLSIQTSSLSTPIRLQPNKPQDLPIGEF